MKTILITGSTDGIGLEAAKTLAGLGHQVLLHGRSPDKLNRAKAEIATGSDRPIDGWTADLSDLNAVDALAKTVLAAHPQLDVLINNAGIFATQTPTTTDGLDVRFVVNTIAPFLLTQRLLPALGNTGRVVNLSSAAQAPVDLEALVGNTQLGDGPAYAQSKLALTMWTRSMAAALGQDGPMIVAVNPGSMLATKMVQQAYGVAGKDMGIGADILRRAAVSEEFANASGQYFDNDAGQFAPPHPDGLDARKCGAVVAAIEALIAQYHLGPAGR